MIHNKLHVSDNHRFLVYADGSPFFYLGDTAWELFHRLDRESAETYLSDRAAKKFTIIQAVVLAEHEYEKPNPYGALPLIDNDPTQPNEPYFAHVDWVVERANALGMYIGMLPTWGDKWNKAWGQGPEIFTPENAHTFGKFLGKRYRDAGIIWILGGDRAVETEEHRAIIRAMASGLKAGDGGAHLMTFHPPGPHTSSEYFPEEAWLDFHMWQSGHSRNSKNYDDIAHDYALAPTKPCLDAEPGYEDHPESFNPNNGYLDETDVRKNAYWAVFAGACGHTYGCHDIWQFLDTARFKAVSWARTPWQEALKLPGAGQVQHVRNLIESRPVLTRIPDQSLILSEAGEGGEHIQATRADNGQYAFVYLPVGQPVTVDLTKIAGTQIKASWYDPRTGEWLLGKSQEKQPPAMFTPPTHGIGQDWVLVLDQA